MTYILLKIYSNKILNFVSSIIIVLIFLAIVSVSLSYTISSEMLEKFKMDSEYNLVSYFSSLLLAFASILLFEISRRDFTCTDSHQKHWKSLSLIFAVLSIDETVSFHEHIIYWFHFNLNLEGAAQKSWGAIGLLVVIFFLWFFNGFIRSIPQQTKKGFFLAGFTFISGALGFEFIGGHIIDNYGDKSWLYAACGIVEETLEMFGV